MRRPSAWSIVLTAVLAVGVCSAPLCAEEERLVVEGRVNGRPARLVFDTGTSFPLAMPRHAMAKYDLELDEARPIDTAAAGVLEGFSVVGRIELPPAYVSDQAVFAILTDAPWTFEWGFDAIIGWPAGRDNRLHYSRRRGSILEAVPNAATGWQAFSLLESNVLTFDAGGNGGPLEVMVDTGWSGGVQLSPELWKEWRAQNSDRPYTLVNLTSPAFGLVVLEQVFAPRLEIGGATLSNVLVSEAPPADEARGWVPPPVTLGLAAFASHELLIDGPGRMLYISPAESGGAPPPYNRLGATFLPGTMAAKVAPGSPTAAADIRDGDVLVAIEGREPGEFAAGLNVYSPWEQPAGTALTLTLERAGERISRRVLLEDFLNRSAR